MAGDSDDAAGSGDRLRDAEGWGMYGLRRA
jgi:hypothetical protein